MEESHFKILTFLSKQTEPVREDRFPNIITSEYSHNTTADGGLIHDLRIVLAATKQWVWMVKYHPNFYIISDFGKAALAREIKNRKENESLQAQAQKLNNRVITISKRTLTWTILGVLLAALIGLLAAYKQGWFF